MKRAFALAVLLAAGCGSPARRSAVPVASTATTPTPPPMTAPPMPPFVLGGTAKLRELDLGRGEAFPFTLELRVNEAGRLERSGVFFLSRGGFTFFVDDPVARAGSLFGAGPALAAGSVARRDGVFSWSAPVDRMVVVAFGKTLGGIEGRAIADVPVLREGFARPPDALWLSDAYVGLEEPVLVLPIDGDPRELVVVGQVVVLARTTATLESLRVDVRDARGSVLLDEELVAKPRRIEADHPTTPFLLVRPLPATFSGGKLSFRGTVDAGSGPMLMERDVPLSVGEPRVVVPPLHGRWHFGNGPGETKLHTHYQFPEQRFAYDLVIEREVGGAHRSYDGDPDKNESYLAFDQPIFAAADGTVVAVADDVPDNLGRNPNPAAKGRGNAYVILDHGGWFTKYSHVREKSARVKPGDRVRAGDRLAGVGNAGQSTEPHLHFAAFHVDETGRVAADPIRIAGLRATNGAPVEMVPRGGVEYVMPLGPITEKSTRSGSGRALRESAIANAIATFASRMPGFRGERGFGTRPPPRFVTCVLPRDARAPALRLGARRVHEGRPRVPRGAAHRRMPSCAPRSGARRRAVRILREMRVRGADVDWRIDPLGRDGEDVRVRGRPSRPLRPVGAAPRPALPASRADDHVPADRPAVAAAPKLAARARRG